MKCWHAKAAGNQQDTLSEELLQIDEAMEVLENADQREVTTEQNRVQTDTQEHQAFQGECSTRRRHKQESPHMHWAAGNFDGN